MNAADFRIGDKISHRKPAQPALLPGFSGRGLLPAGAAGRILGPGGGLPGPPRPAKTGGRSAASDNRLLDRCPFRVLGHWSLSFPDYPHDCGIRRRIAVEPAAERANPAELGVFGGNLTGLLQSICLNWARF